MVTINYECVAATLTLTWVLEHFRWSCVAWVRRKDLRNQSCVAKTVYVVGRVVAYDPLFQSCSDSLGKFNGWNSESIHRAFQAHCAKSQQFCVHVQRFLRCFEGPKRSLRNGQYSSAPYSQAAERAIPHMCEQVRKRPTRVQRRLSLTQLFISGGWVLMLGMKVRNLVVFCSCFGIGIAMKLFQYYETVPILPV